MIVCWGISHNKSGFSRIVRLWAFFIFSIGVCPVFAQPRIAVVEGKIDYDFGSVRPGAVMTYKILLENQGDQNLTLNLKQKSCNKCIPLTLDTLKVEPGKRATLTVRYEAGKKKGKQTPRSYLETNDPENGKMEIVMRWEVDPYIEVNPEAIQFGRKLWRARICQPVQLVTENLNDKIRILQAESASSHVRVSASEVEVRNNCLELPVEILDTTPAGNFSTTVTLTTDYEKTPKIEIPVSGEVLGPMICQPQYLNFGVLLTSGSQEKAIDVHLEPGTKFSATLLGFRAEKGGKNLKQRPSFLEHCELVEKADVGYQLVGRLLATLKPGNYKTIVVLKTDCPIQPEIEIPVLAVVKPEKTEDTRD
ncbi:MAG TPA: DUF1573 domain-containing protein [Candidatus Sumerlaeota bacterium]|nr:DUF1573 domain-containing protein [Candidatus Sumerlaeota bacterium]